MILCHLQFLHRAKTQYIFTVSFHVEQMHAYKTQG